MNPPVPAVAPAATPTVAPTELRRACRARSTTLPSAIPSALHRRHRRAKRYTRLWPTQCQVRRRRRCQALFHHTSSPLPTSTPTSLPTATGTALVEPSRPHLAEQPFSINITRWCFLSIRTSYRGLFAPGARWVSVVVAAPAVAGAYGYVSPFIESDFENGSDNGRLPPSAVYRLTPSTSPGPRSASSGSYYMYTGTSSPTSNAVFNVAELRRRDRGGRLRLPHVRRYDWLCGSAGFQ